MNSKLVKKTVCLLVVMAMILSTILVFPIGFAGRGGTGTYEINGTVVYNTIGTTESNTVPEATVILYNLSTGKRTPTTTDSSGAYTFTNVVPGHYQVIVKPPSNIYISTNKSISDIIEIDDKDRRPVFLYLDKVPFLAEYSLQGYITDLLNDQLIENATVTLKSLDYPGYEITSIETNETGEYKLKAYRGLYELWATAPDFSYFIDNKFNFITKMENHNLSLNSTYSRIQINVGFSDEIPPDKIDAFLIDMDTQEIIHVNFTGFFRNIKAYYGNFSLILDAPGFKPYYHQEIIQLNKINPTYKVPEQTLQKVPDEKIVTTATFSGNNWNTLKLLTVWTLNHDSELFGLELVDYGDPITIGCPRFQVDMQSDFGGLIDGVVGGEVENEEVAMFDAWLKERGPYHQYTNDYFEVKNASEKDYDYYSWKKSTSSVSSSGFAGGFGAMNAMLVISNVDYTHYPESKPLDAEKYNIRFRNLRENEVIVFNVPAGFEISNVNSYDDEKVWVKAYNQCQINASATITVEKLKDPTALITDNSGKELKDIYVKILENVSFNGSYSTPGSGTIIDYLWDFADGYTESGKALEHNFTDPGIFNVTLKVVTQAGLEDTDWVNITVDNIKPTGVIEFQNETGVVITQGKESTPDGDYVITFNASKSSDKLGDDDNTEGKIDGYYWTFGDASGNTGQGEVVTHFYINPGTYEVTLNLTDAAGLYTVITRNLKITDEEPPNPRMKTEPIGRTCNIGEWIILNATLTTENSMLDATWEDIRDNLTFSWDLDRFEDGPDADDDPENDVDATGAIYNFTPDRPGQHAIVLWVTDPSGNVGNSTVQPPEEWTIDVIGTNLRFALIQEEISTKFIESSKKTPKENENVEFKVNVTNLNQLTAWDIIVTFYVDGKKQASKTIDKLEQDDFKILKFKWKAKGVEKHNISFNVTLVNESYEVLWDNNDRSMELEVLANPPIETSCLIVIVVIVIVVILVIIYFYKRRREERAELGKRREKGKGKGKRKGKGKEKGKKKAKETD